MWVWLQALVDTFNREPREESWWEHDAEHCDCCVWFSELGYGIKKDYLEKAEREWGESVNSALKTWEILPDGQRTAQTFQQLLATESLKKGSD